MTVKFEWHGRDCTSHILGKVSKEVKEIGKATLKLLKERVNLPFPPKSRAMAYPKRRTGEFRKSLFCYFEAENLKGRPEATVGSDSKVGTYLEFGTENMSARPWLSKVVNEIKQRYRTHFRRSA